MDVQTFLKKVCERPSGFTEVRRDGKDQDAVVKVIKNEIKICEEKGMPDNLLCKHIEVFASSAWVCFDFDYLNFNCTIVISLCIHKCIF